MRLSIAIKGVKIYSTVATQFYHIPFSMNLRFETLGSLILGINTYVIITILVICLSILFL